MLPPRFADILRHLRPRPVWFVLQVARHPLRKPAHLYPNARKKKIKNTRKELLLQRAGSASLALLSFPLVLILGDK